jgi:aspartate/methionine/tyrosine aminotransferase
MTQMTLRGPLVPPFYSGQIGRRATARLQRGELAIGMHFGQPSSGAPAAAIAAAHRALDTDRMGYSELEALRQRIAQHYAATYGVTVAAEQVLLTAGASAGLVAAFTAMFRRGDRVAVLRPGYPAYRNTLLALGIDAVEVACGAEYGYKLRPELLAALSQAPNGLILASPANPTGAMLAREELAAVINYCARQGIAFISDEIYHGISFKQRAVSALEIDANAIVLNSFSKLYRMPGWRLGWMVVPREWSARLSAYLINMFLTPSGIAQHAALAAMDATEDLEAWVRVYARNRERLLSGLAVLGIVRVAPPDGAFYLYADIGHITQDSLQFCIRLVEDTGLAIAPGIDFDTEHGRRYVRFSFAVSPEEVDHALTLLADWLPGYADRAERAP